MLELLTRDKTLLPTELGKILKQMILNANSCSQVAPKDIRLILELLLKSTEIMGIKACVELLVLTNSARFAPDDIRMIIELLLSPRLLSETTGIQKCIGPLIRTNRSRFTPGDTRAILKLLCSAAFFSGQTTIVVTLLTGAAEELQSFGVSHLMACSKWTRVITVPFLQQLASGPKQKIMVDMVKKLGDARAISAEVHVFIADAIEDDADA